MMKVNKTSKLQALLLGGAILALTTIANAATIVFYDFAADAGPTTELADTSSTAVTSTSAQWTGGTNNGPSNSSFSYFGRGPKNTLTGGAPTSYIQFTISADPTFTLDLTDLSFRYHMSQIQSSSPSFTFQTRSSVDNFATAISGTYAVNPFTTGGGLQTATFDLSGGAYNNLENITFRLYVLGNVTPNTNDIARWDNILVEGDFSPIPEPSTAILGGLGLLTLLRRRR